MILFDADTKQITVSKKVTAEDIYSSWKRWVLESDNMKYLPAFEVIENEEIYYKLTNNWRLSGDKYKAIRNIL